MEIDYHRSASASYMILPQEYEVRTYEEQMLLNNEIPNLLTFFGRRIDDKRQLWYDITSKKSFRSYCTNSVPQMDEMAAIFEKIILAYHGLKEYLISDTRILLNEDTLYLSGRGDEINISLCFYPGARSNLQKQLMGLYEFLMPLTDQGDEAFARFIFEGYELVSDEAFSLDEWAKTLEGISPVLVPQEEVCDSEPAFEQKPQERENELSTEQRRALLDELFEDDEEEEKTGVKDRIGGLFKGIGRGLHRKKESYFPPKDLDEDLIYDPSCDISPPAEFSAENKNSCSGRLIYEGEGNEKDYMISKESNMVGSRDRNNDVKLNSKAVSRHHAIIRCLDNRYYLEDLGSTNGTHLNGRQLRPGKSVELSYMDRISFADVCFMLI